MGDVAQHEVFIDLVQRFFRSSRAAPGLHHSRCFRLWPFRRWWDCVTPRTPLSMRACSSPGGDERPPGYSRTISTGRVRPDREVFPWKHAPLLMDLSVCPCSIIRNRAPGYKAKFVSAGSVSLESLFSVPAEPRPRFLQTVNRARISRTGHRPGRWRRSRPFPRRAFEPHVVLPSQLQSRFHRHPGLDLGRKHLGAVFEALPVEQFPAGQRDDAQLDLFLRQLPCRLEREVHLRARGISMTSGRAPGTARGYSRPSEVPAGAHSFLSMGGRSCRVRMSAVGPSVFLSAALWPGRFQGVGRPDDREVRDAPQAHEVLHGLVSGSVLAHADAVVGEDVDDPGAA